AWITALAVLEQSPRAHNVFSELEHTHEAIAHHAVLLLARAAARHWRRVILRKGNAHSAGKARRGDAGQGVAERDLRQVGHVGMALQPMDLAPGHFPIAINTL